MRTFIRPNLSKLSRLWNEIGTHPTMRRILRTRIETSYPKSLPVEARRTNSHLPTLHHPSYSPRSILTKGRAAHGKTWLLSQLLLRLSPNTVHPLQRIMPLYLHPYPVAIAYLQFLRSPPVLSPPLAKVLARNIKRCTYQATPALIQLIALIL